MNIFYLNHDPYKCVKWYVNKHVVKMIVETTQLLSFAYHSTNQDDLSVYKLSHYNHPCAKWCRYSIDNWNWLLKLGLALSSEYTYRYHRCHACRKHLVFMYYNPPNLISKGFTTPAIAMDNKYKISSDPIECYKEYYRKGKIHLFQWKYRNKPKWIEDS